MPTLPPAPLNARRIPQPGVRPPQPLAHGLNEQWALDPSDIFLNHGCFGARPKSVLEAQWRTRLAFESKPVDWLERHRAEHIDKAKRSLGSFIGMHPNNFGFVTNATGAVNSVLRSLTFKPGDELLTTDHVYNAVRQTMKHVAARHGASYIEAPISMPLHHDDQIVASIAQAMTPRTRILVVDHVTSPTAVIFPIKKILELCQHRGVDVLIDGAHAPGMVSCSIENLGATYYAGNLHKWVCAPPGAAFLWVRPDRQSGIHPATISHFLDEGFLDEFNWQATRDISPWICVEHSIAYMQGLGWDRVMQHNHQLAAWVQSMLCERWTVEPSTPLDGSMIGSMTTVLLPRQDLLRQHYENEIAKLRDTLYVKYRIEVPIVDWGGRWWTRPSCQVYNVPEHYEQLAAAVLELAK